MHWRLAFHVTAKFRMNECARVHYLLNDKSSRTAMKVKLFALPVDCRQSEPQCRATAPTCCMRVRRTSSGYKEKALETFKQHECRAYLE